MQLLLLFVSLLAGACAEIIKPAIATTLPTNFLEAKYSDEDFPDVSFLKLSETDRVAPSTLEKVPSNFEESSYNGENFFNAPTAKKVFRMSLEKDWAMIETEAVIDKPGVMKDSEKPVLRFADASSWTMANYKEDMIEFLEQHATPKHRRHNPKMLKSNLLEMAAESLDPVAQTAVAAAAAAAVPKATVYNGPFVGDRHYLFWSGADTDSPQSLINQLPDTTSSYRTGFYSDGTPHPVNDSDYYGEVAAAAGPPA